MKSAILYAMTEKPKAILEYSVAGCKTVSVWIRMEIVNADALHALDMAKPRPGEIVLNSVEL